MDIATQFNIYNYRSYPLAVLDTTADLFLPDDNLVYLVRSIRVTNYSEAAETVTAAFYSGELDQEFFICSGESVDSSEGKELLAASPIVIRGDHGDRLRMIAGSAGSIHAVATAMILGRQTGL